MQGVAVPCTLFSAGEGYGSNKNSSYKTNDQDNYVYHAVPSFISRVAGCK